MFVVKGVDCCLKQWNFKRKFATEALAQKFIDDTILVPAWGEVWIEQENDVTVTSIITDDVGMCAA